MGNVPLLFISPTSTCLNNTLNIVGTHVLPMSKCISMDTSHAPLKSLGAKGTSLNWNRGIDNCQQIKIRN